MKLFWISVNDLCGVQFDMLFCSVQVSLVIKAKTSDEALEKAKAKYHSVYVNKNNVLGGASENAFRDDPYVELTFDEDGCSDFLVGLSE